MPDSQVPGAEPDLATLPGKEELRVAAVGKRRSCGGAASRGLVLKGNSCQRDRDSFRQ